MPIEPEWRLSHHLAGMIQSEVSDPSMRVICRKCGYSTVLGRFHRLQGIEGHYCRGCGAVIGNDGWPLADRKRQK